MELVCPVPVTGWRPAVSDGIDTIASPTTYTHGGEDSSSLVMTVEFDWEPTAEGEYWIGIEAQRPASTWATVSDHFIQNFTIRESSEDHAYGVPWITVSDACSVDLIVVDDG
jgi:hypothetical protein